jgi:signal transduction histidine kinase
MKIRVLIGLAVLAAVATVAVLAASIPAEAREHEYDLAAGLLGADLAAALAVAGVCAWAAIVGRPLLAVATFGGAAVCLLGDALVGRSSEPSAWHSLGFAASPLVPALLLAAPTLALTKAPRAPIWPALVLGAVYAVANVAFRDPYLEVGCHRACVPNALLITDAGWLVDGARAIAVAAALVCAGMLLAGAMRARASRLLAAATALATSVAAARLIVFAFADDDPRRTGLRALHLTVALAALTLAAVVAEHLTRAPRARERMRRLLRDLRATGAVGAEQCLRDALGEQSLGLAYRYPDRDVLVSPAGLEVDATDPQVEIRRAGEAIAALLRAPAEIDPAVVAAVLGPAGTLTLDNERLAAATRYDLNALRDASCELVALGDAERARIERNLHDGAQQGLVASGMALRLTAMTHPDVDADATLEELGEVIAEVRTIAHGIHPAILAEGLDSAVEFLADEAPIHVESRVSAKALPDAVALTVYIAAEEALANAAAAGATQVKIDVRREQDAVRVTVVDDGPGGAAPIPGGGLETLADRARALDGELTLQSPHGGPTGLTLRLPV